MNTELLTFATQTTQAHIGIVEPDAIRRRFHFALAKSQLHPFIEHVSLLKYTLRLVNGTVIVFFEASRWQRLLGWRFDRIEAAHDALVMMPPHLLDERLKPGILLQEGLFVGAAYLPGKVVSDENSTC